MAMAYISNVKLSDCDFLYKIHLCHGIILFMQVSLETLYNCCPSVVVKFLHLRHVILSKGVAKVYYLLVDQIDSITHSTDS